MAKPCFYGIRRLKKKKRAMYVASCYFKIIGSPESWHMDTPNARELQKKKKVDLGGLRFKTFAHNTNVLYVYVMYVFNIREFRYHFTVR